MNKISASEAAVYFFGLLLSIIVVGGIWFALTALVAWLFKLCFNYIAVNTNHAGSQISFWVAFAIVILLRMIAAFFNTPTEKKE
jgi:hypothetical protein